MYLKESEKEKKIRYSIILPGTVFVSCFISKANHFNIHISYILTIESIYEMLTPLQTLMKWFLNICLFNTHKNQKGQIISAPFVKWGNLRSENLDTLFKDTERVMTELRFKHSKVQEQVYMIYWIKTQMYFNSEPYTRFPWFPNSINFDNCPSNRQTLE